MVARSNLDALTSGMMAKLDPLSRIVWDQRGARWISKIRNESETAPLKHALWPSERLKRREELRTKVTSH